MVTCRHTHTQNDYCNLCACTEGYQCNCTVPLLKIIIQKRLNHTSFNYCNSIAITYSKLPYCSWCSWEVCLLFDPQCCSHACCSQGASYSKLTYIVCLLFPVILASLLFPGFQACLPFLSYVPAVPSSLCFCCS